jgi:molybdate transport system regulatory protein
LARAADGARKRPEGLRLRLVFEDGAMIGPGKADLLEAIGRTGSITAAGRALGMSYKRAWSLVETLNETFGAPLVARSRGGARHGGATLTPLGAEALALFRALETRAAEAGAGEIAALNRLRAPRDEPEA